jgi:hypothetical protein
VKTKKESAPSRLITAALIAFLLVSASLLSPKGWAQADRGSISGTVVDPTGLPVKGVQVSITELVKGVSYTGSTTDDRGVYRIINLPIGTYSLSFKATGFKQYDQTGITLVAAQDARVDVKLQVGSVIETVTVTTDADLIDTYSATEATTVNALAIQELPLSIMGGRNAISFANMAVPTVGGGIVANSLTVSSNVMVDGVDADATLQGQQQPPGVEAVQEVQVQTSGIDAEAAQTGGGTFQYELKSGTNQFHGSAFAFRTNEALDANHWDNNYWLAYCAAAGAGSSEQCPTDYKHVYKRPFDRLKDWGFSAGGPIWKKHTFVFGAYERYNQNTMAWAPNSITVPTSKMLSGDFSELLTFSGILNAGFGCTSLPCWTGQNDAGGNPIYYGAIFDPSHPGDVFAGNIIPSGQISPQSQKIVSIYKADYAPTNGNLVNNYWGFSGATNTVQNLDVKLDHHFSEKNHASGSVNWAKTELVAVGNHTQGYLWQKGSLTGGPFADSQAAPFKYATIHLADAYTLTPTLMNDAILAFNWANKGDLTAAPAGKQFGNISSLFPTIFFKGGSLGSGEQAIGQNFDDYIRWQQIRLKDTLDWVHGKHVTKFGGEYVSYGSLNNFPPGITTYQFINTIGMPESLANTPLAGFLGSSFASMLLGMPTAASQGVLEASHTIRRAFDFLASDQFRATSKLTLNLSLRWDVNARLHEQNGLWSNYNFNEQNPSWPGLMGRIDYLTGSSQSYETNEDYHLLSPHVGAAYQLSQKLVLRAAWGLYYVPLGNNTWGGLPYSSMAGSCFQCYGSNVAPPAASIVVPAFQWDQNVYPGVAYPGAKNSTGNVGGWGMAYLDPNNLTLGRTQNWNAGVEYGFNKNTVLDVRYMGNKGSDLHDGSLYPQNYPTWAAYRPLLASGHAGDWITDQAGAQAAGVPWYPFIIQTVNGYGGYQAVNAITPTAQQPQAAAFWGPPLIAGYPHGSSGFNGLVVEVKKRTGSGLSMDLSYTYSKAVQNVSNWFNSVNGGNMTDGWINASEFQDPYSYNQFTGLISPNDMRHVVKGYVTYNLPFGKHGHWLQQSGALDYLVGGWTLSGVVNYHSGLPMAAVYADFGYPGWSQVFANVSNAPGALSNHFKRLDLANPTDPSNMYFDQASFTDPVYGQLGNQQPYFSNWRGWAYYNEDLGIVKRFAFGRDNRFQATLRAEFFDVLNHHTWAAPNSYSPGSANFGYVTGVFGNRTGQFGARFAW